MPYVEAGGKLIYFAHVPKAGGTSVEHYLAQRFGVLSLHEGDWMARWMANPAKSQQASSPQHMTGTEAIEKLPRNPDFSFVIVRDPVARVISEYQMHRRSRWPRRRIAALGFQFWLGAMLSASARDAGVFDNHFRPATDFLLPETKVFRLEDGLGAVEQWLDAVTGTSAAVLSIGHALKAKSETKPTPDPANIAAVRRRFAEDCRRYGYPAAEPAPMAGLTFRLGSLLGPWVARSYRKGRL